MPPAGCISAGPIRRWTQERRLHGPKMARRRRLRARQPARPNRARQPRRRGSASSPPARPISICGRRWPISGITDEDRARSRPAHLQGRADLAAGRERRAAFRRRARGRSRRRGKARLRRRSAPAHPLQSGCIEAPDRRRQARRNRRRAAAERRRADADDRGGAR